MRNKEEVKKDSEEDDGKAYSKMPHMTLPTFDGEVIEYREFREHFKYVLSTMKVARGARITYLLGRLKGDANIKINAADNCSRLDVNLCNGGHW